MRTNKYTVRIDKEACIGCGVCNELAPKIFTSDNEMKSELRQDAEIDEKLLLKAAEECASGAIVIIDNETGEQLWPKND